MDENKPTILLEDNVYWFDGDRFMSEVIRGDIETFNIHFDLLGDSLLSLLPDCRKFARKEFLHDQSLSIIIDWCLDENDREISDDVIRQFFYEDVELVFVSMFKKRIKNYTAEKSPEEVREILIRKSIKLKGASLKKLVMMKWTGE